MRNIIVTVKVNFTMNVTVNFTVSIKGYDLLRLRKVLIAN